MSWVFFFSDREQEFPKHEDGKISKYDHQIIVPLWVLETGTIIINFCHRQIFLLPYQI